MGRSDPAGIAAERIGIIKPSAFGDVVQAMSILPALRQRFPQARVSWVINRELTGLLEGQPEVDDVIPFARHGSWSDWGGLLQRLRRERFDLVLDLQGLLRSAVMLVATRAPMRVGIEAAREGAGFACHVLAPGSGWDVSALERYHAAARAVGCEAPFPPLRPAVPPEAKDWCREQVRGLPQPLVLIHPGAKWVTKRWPPAQFAAVAAKAIRRWGAAIGLIGGRDDVGLAAEIELLLKELAPAARVKNWVSRTTLPQLKALLISATALVCNDSGPMHLAAALGTPVVGVFTCTSPALSGPPGPQHRLIATTVACAAGYHKICPRSGKGHLACFEAVGAERVFAGLCEVVEARLQSAAG